MNQSPDWLVSSGVSSGGCFRGEQLCEVEVSHRADAVPTGFAFHGQQANFSGDWFRSVEGAERQRAITTTGYGPHELKWTPFARPINRV